MGSLHILHWKFMHLDKNTNYQLEMEELQEFLKKTKRKVYPKKCSKTFIGFCDKDNDNKLSLFEWYSCFGVQGLYASVLFNSVGLKARKTTIHCQSNLLSEGLSNC